MKKLLAMVISLTLINNYVSAEGFNYDYVQARIGTTNSQAIDELYIIEVSKSVHENIAVRGGLGYSYGDWNLSGKYKEQSSMNITAEAIFHQELRANTDILLSVGYSNSDYKSTCVTTAAHYICSASTTRLNNHEYYGVSLGIRQRLSDSIEAELHYAGVKANNIPSINQVHLSLMKEITSKLSIGANYRWNTNLNDFNQSEVVLRRQF
ncbi:hypothetical protein N9512_04185 [Amylibacter sp.]|nr:hypothetical protein [Amylibacter sp.]